MKIQFEEGDGDVVKDAQYQKMMRHLRKIAAKGGELEPKALEKLIEQENAAQQSKGKKRSAATATDEDKADDTKTTSDAPFLIQTKRARFTSGLGSKKAASSDDDEFDNIADNGEDDDDDDETKIQPAYMEEDVEGADTHTESAAENDEDYYTKAESIFNEQAPPGMMQTVPIIRINNMVMTVHTGEQMNIKSLLPVLQPFGFYQNTKRFVAMTQRTCDPRSSTLIFGNGKMVNTGSCTADAATNSIQSCVDKIASVSVQIAPGRYYQPHKDMKIKRSMVHNIVGSTTVPFKIDLNVLAKYEFVYYFKLMFVGAIVSIYRISQHEKDRNVKALVFDTGNIVITGAKTTDHIDSVFKLLYPFAARSAVQTTLPSEISAIKSNKRRFDSDRKKAAAIPEGSKSIIKLNPQYLIEGWRAVNDNRETGQQILEREKESQRGTLSGLSTTSINMIAIDSMIQEQRRQDEEPSLLLTQGANDAPKKMQMLDAKSARLFAD